MDNELESPVLFIAFNRPDTTKLVFQKIMEAKPKKLYVAIDGPRKNVDIDKKKVNEVKEIVKKVNWSCDVYYKINEENKGAEITITSAIDWVFENEKCVIIIEDDILAPLSFFNFADEVLKRYKNNDKIWAISGVNFLESRCMDDDDYFFSKYGNTWGWATWKSTWEKFDLNTEIDNKHLENRFLENITNTKLEQKYYKNKFLRIKKNGIGNSTWDQIASYMHRVNNLLYVVPKKNLVSNIGVIGFHANGETRFHNRSFDESFKINIHPKSVECNIEYDKYYFETYLKEKISCRSKIKKIIKKIYDR